MSWQEEIEGETLAEAAQWFLDHVIEGPLLDNQVYEDVAHPWADRHREWGVKRLHRIWACKLTEQKRRLIYCCDLEEYEPGAGGATFFARAIMGADEGPWGIQPPRGFGWRPGGDTLRQPFSKGR